MKLAVVGVTGLVGRTILKVLVEKGFKVDSMIPVASAASFGKIIDFMGEKIEVKGIEEAIELNPGIAIFSAGSSISRRYAPEFARAGTTVIDNSSAWRMHKDIPLVVPEINADILTRDHRIIANPNCSTIQMVMALAPIHSQYGIKRIVVSTYQSVTGSGFKGMRQLENERSGIKGENAYPHAIDLNLIPRAGDFTASGYTSEEVKLVNETRKILRDQSIRITATAVRVPVTGGHSEAVNLELSKPFDINDIRSLLKSSKGIVVEDDPEKDIYPMPVKAFDSDNVFVGRIRRDDSLENGLNLWIVSDNLRKGAATNAVDIAVYLQENNLLA
jgi:aspartate-semialdehyde dehydrogenase